MLCYLAHNQAGSTGFFAVVDVMQHHSISNFGIPKIKRDPTARHIAIFSVRDIIHSVGLLRFSDDENEFKVIWRYQQYDDRIGGRNDGALSDLNA